MSLRPRSRAVSSLATGLLTLLVSGRARAIDPETTSDSVFQAYDIRSPSGQTEIARTRFTSMLGVNLYDITGQGARSRGGPELNFRGRVRFDADATVDGGETSAGDRVAFIPGLRDTSGQVDVMYAYLEGRRFVRGMLGFKLGRQYIVDSLGWWSFDGGLVRVSLPFFVAAEGYVGLEVRGGGPLSTPRFEADGVWRGSRAGYDPSLYPSFQPADVAPAFGAALESSGVPWLRTRLTFRRVYDTGSVGLTELPNANLPPTTYSDTRISSDRLGYSAELDLHRWGALRGGLAYDLYDVRFSQIFGAFDVFATRRLTLGVNYDYFAPVYDADSIWNFFAGDPMNDVSARASYSSDHLSLSAGANLRIYTVDTADPNPASSSPNVGAGLGGYYPTNGHPFDEGGDFAARYKWGEGSVGLRSAVNIGDAGDRVGADISAQRVLETRYLLRGRLGIWQWDDKLRPDRDATNLGYVLGVGYRFFPRCQSVVEWQHDMNRLVGQRYRVLVTLTLALNR